MLLSVSGWTFLASPDAPPLLLSAVWTKLTGTLLLTFNKDIDPACLGNSIGLNINDAGDEFSNNFVVGVSGPEVVCTQLLNDPTEDPDSLEYLGGVEPLHGIFDLQGNQWATGFYPWTPG